MDQIIPFLFISDWNSSNNIDLLCENEIKAVITMETAKKPDFILKYYEDNNIDFLQCKLLDLPSQDISSFFDITFSFINKYVKQNQNVLVHCAAGISRSATIIINYIGRCMYFTDNTTEYIYNFRNVSYSSNDFIDEYRVQKCQPAYKVLLYILKMLNITITKLSI